MRLPGEIAAHLASRASFSRKGMKEPAPPACLGGSQ